MTAAWRLLVEGMRRRKSLLLIGLVAGGLLLAEAGTLALAAQVAWAGAGLAVRIFAVLAAVLWTILLAAGLVGWVRRLLFAGMVDASDRLEAARSAVQVGFLGATPTIQMLSRAVERQDASIAELRNLLLASAITGKGEGSGTNSLQLARAAGLAAGILAANGNLRRLVVTLENWVVSARSRQEVLRGRTEDLRRCFENLPRALVADGRSGPPERGYAAVDDSPWSDEEPDALPESLKRRLRGLDCWSPSGDEDADRN